MGFAICLTLQVLEILTFCYKTLVCLLPYPELYIQPHSLSTTVFISMVSIVHYPHSYLHGRATTPLVLQRG